MKAFTNAVLAALAVAFASATPTPRDASALSVTIEAPEAVTSLSDLKVTSKVTNTGSEPVKVLKFNTPLEASKLQNFQLTRDGNPVAFRGIKAQFDLSRVEDVESVYVTIAPGETVSVEHPIGELFDFSEAGAYEITSANKYFFADSAKKSVNDLEVAAATSNSVTIGVSGELKDNTIALEKRARQSGCSTSQSSFVFSALSEGAALASKAASYISSNGASSAFTSYFGSGSTSTIQSRFSSLASSDHTNTGSGDTWYCSDPAGACTSGVIAYSYQNSQIGAFCSIFFQEVPTTTLCSGGTTVAARNVRGATWLHEKTHMIFATDDYGYGVSFDQSIARSNPTEARNNADNYNVFAETVAC